MHRVVDVFVGPRCWLDLKESQQKLSPIGPLPGVSMTLKKWWVMNSKIMVGH